MLKDILLAGSATRYAVSAAMLSFSGLHGFPAGTLLVNASGSLQTWVLWTSLAGGGWQTFAVTGFCGGFTTFSAFSLKPSGCCRMADTASRQPMRQEASVYACCLHGWALQ